jgi:hypothetical protein
MTAITRRDLVLLLLGISPTGELSEGIGGITRLQKLLFLLEREQDLVPLECGFDFAAYKAGPYSSRLYDDLEFLENLGLIESQIAAEATTAEAAEVDLLNFDELMGDSADVSGATPADGLGAADAYEERRFQITEEGRKHITSLIESGTYKPVIDGVRRIKSKYGNYSLSDLLCYVYKKYPEMTVESEIKEKVLRKQA